jgi:hypothetical protein
MPDASTFPVPERRSAAAPAGLPILSTEKLTAAEREAMRELRRRYQLAVATIDDCLDAGRVDRALDGLQHVASETDGLALRVVAKLGANR